MNVRRLTDWLLSNPNGPSPKEWGANPPIGVAHGEEHEAGGGGPPEHNLRPPAGGQPGAPLGGE